MLAASTAASAASPFNLPKTVPGGDHPEGIATADFNGDSLTDVATSNVGGDDVSILLGAGAGVLGSPTSVGAADGYENPEAIAVGHFDAGSDPDLAVGYFEPEAAVLLGGSGATFGAPSPLGTGQFSRAIAVGDFNEDSEDDLAVVNLANPAATTVMVALGNGDGTFGSPTSFDVGTEPVAVAVGDIDGDSNLDIVTANSGSDDVSVLLGDGLGGFADPANFDVGTDPQTVAIADFDEDGNSDLAVGNLTSADVSLLLGDGAGGFDAPTSLQFGMVPETLAVDDFNGDHHADLVAGGSSGIIGVPSAVSVRMGDGDGGFGPSTLTRVGSTNNWVTTGKFNADSDPDIAVASEGDSTVSVLLNAAHAPNAPTLTSTTPASPANNNLPVANGEAPAGSTVSLYTSADCSGPPLATASAEDFSSDGLAYSVGDNTTTTVHAAATNTVGVSSDCSNGLTYVEDSQSPDTSIDSVPDDPTNDQTPTYGFSSPDPTADFQCRFDSDPFGPCSGPGDTHTPPSDLPAGVHTFDVRAVDQAGNLDATPASSSITIDLQPPTVTITSGPTGTSNQNFTAIAFAADEPVSSFECQIEGAGYVVCNSGVGFGLAEGPHTVDVRATDLAGNTGTSTSRSWIIDTSSPTSTISGTVGPGKSVSTDPAGAGPSASIPVTTAITLPDGGEAEVVTGPATTAPPSGLSILGVQFEITAPDATAAEPLVLTFRIDSSQIPSGTPTGSITLLRDGAAAADCAGAPGVADPDPCVAARTMLSDGDVSLTVFSSHASTWNVAAGPPPASAPAPVPPGGQPGPKTGKRAKALKKCKKKRGKARKRCIKKAKKLPQ